MDRLPATINRLAPGLLSLLGLQNSGRNPDAMSNVVAPVMELRDWYFSGVYESVFEAPSISVNANGVFTAADLTVPQGEYWWVDSLVFFAANVPAGTSAYLQGSVQTNGVGGAISCYPQDVLNITGPGITPSSGERGFIMRPGDVPQVRAWSLVAGPISVDVAARIVRLRV